MEQVHDLREEFLTEKKTGFRGEREGEKREEKGRKEKKRKGGGFGGNRPSEGEKFA